MLEQHDCVEGIRFKAKALAPERGEAYCSCICRHSHAWEELTELAMEAIVAM